MARSTNIPTWRKLLYTLLLLGLILAALEGALRHMDYQGTTLAELKAASAMPESVYIERRDRILGDWYIDDASKEGAWMRANPALLTRGFHDERFPRAPGRQVRLFALGGSTTLGSPFR